MESLTRGLTLMITLRGLIRKRHKVYYMRLIFSHS